MALTGFWPRCARRPSEKRRRRPPRNRRHESCVVAQVHGKETSSRAHCNRHGTAEQPSFNPSVFSACVAIHNHTAIVPDPFARAATQTLNASDNNQYLLHGHKWVTKHTLP
eukprot:scpid69072/ scgid4799/ 